MKRSLTRQPTRKGTALRAHFRKKTNLRRQSILENPKIQRQIMSIQHTLDKPEKSNLGKKREVKFNVPQVWIDKENDLKIEGGWGIL